MAEPEAEEKVLQATQQIEHSVFVNERMLIALLKRCGHEIDAAATTVRWLGDGARVTWTTSLL